MNESTFNASDAIGSLEALRQGLDRPALVALVTEQTGHMHADALSRAPVTRFNQYRQAIRKKVFDDDDGAKGTVFVVQGPWERNPGQKWPANVPIWIEWGTVKLDPRAHLVPAFNAARERFNRAMERLLEKLAR